jgi:predicted DCC family thiol-disulfide oxidoreductase YuxK
MTENHTGEIVMHYDTSCTFCCWCQRFVEHRAREPIAYRHTDNQDTITVVTPTGKHLEKYAASMYIGKQLRQPWRLCAQLGSLLPRLIGDRIYDWVKRNRNLLVRVFGIK